MVLIIEIIVGLAIIGLLAKFVKEVLPIVIILVVLYLMIEYWKYSIILIGILGCIIAWSNHETIKKLNEEMEEIGFISEPELAKRGIKPSVDFLVQGIKQGKFKKDRLYDDITYFYKTEKLDELKSEVDKQVVKDVDDEITRIGIFKYTNKNVNITNENDKLGSCNSIKVAYYKVSLRDYLKQKVDNKELLYINCNNDKESKYLYFNFAFKDKLESLFSYDFFNDEKLKNLFDTYSLSERIKIMNAMRGCIQSCRFQYVRLFDKIFDSEHNFCVLDKMDIWINDKIKTNFICSSCGKTTTDMIKYGNDLYCEDCIGEIRAESCNAENEEKRIKRYIASPPPGVVIVGLETTPKKKGLSALLDRFHHPND